MGMLTRRSFRRMLVANNVPFTEDAAWLDSQFVVDASPDIIAAITRKVNEIRYQSEFEEYTYAIKHKHTAEFKEHIELFYSSSVSVITSNRGWFSTRFTVICHPSANKNFQEYADKLNRLK